jgi:electron-transferring-flavoprotein dehydrogenase
MDEASHPSMDVDIVCVGFGPAAGGFLTTLARAIVDEHGNTRLPSRAMPGMPLQVVCYERADDLGFGVSGVVSRARAIRASFPDLDPAAIPLAHPVAREEVLYLQDHLGTTRRSRLLRCLDAGGRAARFALPQADHAVRLPFAPAFLRKEGGLVLSVGQFCQWVAAQLMATGLVQLWPGTPVAAPLLQRNVVSGVRLADQGTDRSGRPAAGYLPGMDVRAALTVVADGPFGTVGRRLDAELGLPADHHQREWAVGMKVVVDLPPDCLLTPGTVIHTVGFPEPEIFGFLYVFPGRIASLGIFVPSWLDSPVRASYRYLQHWMQHPALWRHLEGAPDSSRLLAPQERIAAPSRCRHSAGCCIQCWR